MRRSSSIPTGCFPPIRRRARSRARSMPTVAGPADRQPARPYRSRLVRRRRGLDRRDRACCSRPTIISTGCSTARACALDRLGVPRSRRRRPRPIRARPGGCSPAHYHLFRGTPSRLWLDHVFAEVFGIEVALEAATADLYFDRSARRWRRRPSARAPCSTASGSSCSPPPKAPHDDLSAHHAAIRALGLAAAGSSPPIAPTR